jgi:DNA-binding CsgD family transcriptional regulator
MASELESFRRPARRADAGVVRATERDLRLLRWVAQQYAVSIPQLARLMGRSEHAARWLRGRWQRAGWAQGRTLLVGRPVFVWLTRDGSRVAGVGFKVWEPNAGALAHIEAVNEVRLLVAQRRPEGVWPP